MSEEQSGKTRKEDLAGPLPAVAGALPSLDEESLAFWRMRLRTLRTSARQTLSLARFRLGLVLVLSALLWSGVFWLLFDGFKFLYQAIPHTETLDQMLQTVFAAFFLALFVMLLFSSGIVLYGSLFCAREATLLLTLPTRDGRVFLHKFQEAVVLNSWGFLLLGSPLLLAFGIVAKAPWYYYAVLLPFMLAFTYVPMAMGAIFCLALVRCVPRAGNLLWILGGAVLLSIATAAGWWLLTSRESNLLTPAWFQEMTGRLQFTQSRLLPSWWLSAGLLEAAHDNGAECLKFLALMIANALFWREVAIHVAVRVYRAAYEGVHGQAFGPRRAGAARSTPPSSARWRRCRWGSA